MKRGNYGQMIEIKPAVKRQVINLLKSVAENADEHGGWEFGAEFDSKGRGSALNWDLYAFGRDMHTHKSLAVVQVRQYVKRHKGWYPSVRRNYFLIGRNEDGTAFAHPVQSRVVHTAAATGKNIIRAVQRWMFKCGYEDVVRQGDVAFVPMQRIKGELRIEKEVLLAESHKVVADEIRENGEAIYVLNPSSTHQTHDSVKLQGWWKIVVGRRARYWKFARPSKD